MTPSPREPKASSRTRTPARSWRPRSAMVLAAGLGKRMRPLTDDRPKPLVALDGAPLIDRVLDRLAAADVATAVVNVHYRADQLVRHLEPRKTPRIVISDERETLLDTGGGVRRALAALGPEPFLVHNADSVWIEGVGANLERLAAAWDPEVMDALLLVALGASSVGYEGRGDFRMAADGALTRRGEREVVPFVYTGVALVHPRLFADAPEGPFSLNRVWDEAHAAGRLYGVRLAGTWMHVGTLDAVEAAERALQDAAGD